MHLATQKYRANDANKHIKRTASYMVLVVDNLLPNLNLSNPAHIARVPDSWSYLSELG